jgi:hypothetical protein
VESSLPVPLPRPGTALGWLPHPRAFPAAAKPDNSLAN